MLHYISFIFLSLLFLFVCLLLLLLFVCVHNKLSESETVHVRTPPSQILAILNPLLHSQYLRELKLVFLQWIMLLGYLKLQLSPTVIPCLSSVLDKNHPKIPGGRLQNKRLILPDQFKPLTDYANCTIHVL